MGDGRDGMVFRNSRDPPKKNKAESQRQDMLKSTPKIRQNVTITTESELDKRTHQQVQFASFATPAAFINFIQNSGIIEASVIPSSTGEFAAFIIGAGLTIGGDIYLRYTGRWQNTPKQTPEKIVDGLIGTDKTPGMMKDGKSVYEGAHSERYKQQSKQLEASFKELVEKLEINPETGHTVIFDNPTITLDGRKEKTFVAKREWETSLNQRFNNIEKQVNGFVKANSESFKPGEAFALDRAAIIEDIRGAVSLASPDPGGVITAINTAVSEQVTEFLSERKSVPYADILQKPKVAAIEAEASGLWHKVDRPAIVDYVKEEMAKALKGAKPGAKIPLETIRGQAFFEGLPSAYKKAYNNNSTEFAEAAKKAGFDFEMEYKTNIYDWVAKLEKKNAAGKFLVEKGRKARMILLPIAIGALFVYGYGWNESRLANEAAAWEAARQKAQAEHVADSLRRVGAKPGETSGAGVADNIRDYVTITPLGNFKSNEIIGYGKVEASGNEITVTMKIGYRPPKTNIYMFPDDGVKNATGIPTLAIFQDDEGKWFFGGGNFVDVKPFGVEIPNEALTAKLHIDMVAKSFWGEYTTRSGKTGRFEVQTPASFDEAAYKYGGTYMIIKSSLSSDGSK